MTKDEYDRKCELVIALCDDPDIDHDDAKLALMIGLSQELQDYEELHFPDPPERPRHQLRCELPIKISPCEGF